MDSDEAWKPPVQRRAVQRSYVRIPGSIQICLQQGTVKLGGATAGAQKTRKHGRARKRVHTRSHACARAHPALDHRMRHAQILWALWCMSVTVHLWQSACFSISVAARAAYTLDVVARMSFMTWRCRQCRGPAWNVLFTQMFLRGTWEIYILKYKRIQVQNRHNMHWGNWN